jgi:hypothetical protein
MNNVINFYKGIEKVYSVYANNIDDVKNNPLSYFPEYTENMVITDKEFQYPIQDENGLREMTREEKAKQGIEIQLEEGEILKNKKIIKIERPSKYHQWMNNKWEIELETVKEKIRNIFKQELQSKIYSDFNYKSYVFQMGASDIPNFERVKMALDIVEKEQDVKKIIDVLKELDSNLATEVKAKVQSKEMTKELLISIVENFKTGWRLKDNSVLEVTYKEITNILLLWIFRSSKFNNEYNEINELIKKSNAVEELEAIEWK